MHLVILDRDGVINQESLDYIKSPDEWIAITGSLQAISDLNAAGFTVVIASNQSGIARGLFDTAMLSRIHDKLHSELAKVNGKIDKIFFCPHHPVDECSCRKPQPGMLLEIAKQYAVDLSQIYFIGDSLTDIQAAKKAGCKPILVLTGKGAGFASQATDVPCFNDLAAAAQFLIQEGKL